MAHTLPVTGNTEHTAPENRAFYPALDGLRAIAFLMVFFWHYEAFPWGWAGVNVFFVLSGFLITGILFDTRLQRHRARNFYVRRTLRIFPLYYGVFLVLLLLDPIEHWTWSRAWLAWPAYLGNFMTLVHAHPLGSRLQRLTDFQLFSAHPTALTSLNFGHFWSLCVEEQFYLIWPWVIFYFRDRRKLIWICAASVPLCLFGRILGLHFLPPWPQRNDIIVRVTPFRVDDLLIGGLLALLLRGPSAQKVLRLSRAAAPFVLAAVLLWLALTPAHHVFMVPYPYPADLLTWGFTAISLLTGLVILLAIQSGTLIYRGLSLRPLRWLGRISYGAYVFHDIFHHFYAKTGLRIGAAMTRRQYPGYRVLQSHPDLAMLTLSFGCTMLLAWLSFHFYESIFLNLKERWTIRG